MKESYKLTVRDDREPLMGTILNVLFWLSIGALSLYYYYKLYDKSTPGHTADLELFIYLIGIIVILNALISLGHTTEVALFQKTITKEGNAIVLKNRKTVEYTIKTDEIKEISFAFDKTNIQLFVLKTNDEILGLKICELYFLEPFQISYVGKFNYLKLMFLISNVPGLLDKVENESHMNMNKLFKLDLDSNSNN
jgi:hypothetical protein